MDNLETPLYSGHHLFSFAVVQLTNVVVTSHNKVLMQQGHSSSFSLSCNWVVIGPKLEKMAKTRLVVIIKQNGVLSRIPVKPLVLSLKVSGWEVVSRIARLANARRTPYPSASCLLSLSVSSLLIFHGHIVETLLSPKYIFYVNQTGTSSCYCSHTLYLKVATRQITSHIAPSRLDTESPRPINAGFFFIAIAIGAIVNADGLKM